MNKTNDRRKFIMGASLAVGCVAISTSRSASAQTQASGILVANNFETLRAMNPIPEAGQVIKITDNFILGDFIVREGNKKDDGAVILNFSGITNKYAERIIEHLINPNWFTHEAGNDADKLRLADELASQMGKSIIIDDNYLLGENHTFQNPVVFSCSKKVIDGNEIRTGIITVQIGATLTINSITAPVEQIFNVITGSSSSHVSVILNKKYAETSWFGAKPDYDRASNTGTDNGVLFNQAVDSVGTAGVVIVDNAGFNIYFIRTTIKINYDELTFMGRQFRPRIQAAIDITMIQQEDPRVNPNEKPTNIRTTYNEITNPNNEAYFGLHLENLVFQNKFQDGSSHVLELNRSFLFRLQNVYIDKGPADGFHFASICAQGVITGCVAEECKGNGFSELSGSRQLSYTDCLSFKNDGIGYFSSNDLNTTGNSLVGCKAMENGKDGFWRGDTGAQLGQCSAINNGRVEDAAGIHFHYKAINASATGCEVSDRRWPDSNGNLPEATQKYGIETTHKTQKIANITGSGNIVKLLNLFEPEDEILIITDGWIALPELMPNSIVRIDTQFDPQVDSINENPHDNLDHISPGYPNQVITLRTVADTRNITFVNANNNLVLDRDFSTMNIKSRLVLQFDTDMNKWVELNRSKPS